MAQIGFQFRPTWTLAIWLCLLASALGQSVQNPHWNKDTCGACHKMVGGQPLPIPVPSITPLCLSCHDGVRASAEPHPIERRLDSTKMTNPRWPLVNGVLECQTCHDARQSCNAPAARPDANSAFLRKTERPFCETCHRPEATPKLNPHLMLSAGKPIDGKCAICHEKPMSNTEMSRTGDPALRADVVTLCRSCHPHHRDISQAGHILVPIPPQMLAYMRARELTGLLGLPSADLIKQLTDDHAMPLLMVPDKQGRVVCYTCHNPHEEKTFPPGSVLEDRALRLRNGHLLTPVRGSQFCRHCHDI